MTRNICIVFLGCLLGVSNAFSESIWQSSTGLGSRHYFVSSGGFFNFPIHFLEKNVGLRLVPGAGVRVTYLEATSRIYQTAGKKEREDNAIEKIEINGTQHLALNTAISIAGEYVPWGVFIGFNIDILGYTVASKRSLKDSKLDGGGVNLLRYGYNDLGTLHSETFVGMNFPKHRFHVRLGTTHSATQYKVKESISGVRASRFLNFSDTVFIGVGLLIL
jgi:hypothetical protein